MAWSACTCTGLVMPEHSRGSQQPLMGYHVRTAPDTPSPFPPSTPHFLHCCIDPTPYGKLCCQPFRLCHPCSLQHCLPACAQYVKQAAQQRCQTVHPCAVFEHAATPALPLSASCCCCCCCCCCFSGGWARVARRCWPVLLLLVPLLLVSSAVSITSDIVARQDANSPPPGRSFAPGQAQSDVIGW